MSLSLAEMKGRGERKLAVAFDRLDAGVDGHTLDHGRRFDHLDKAKTDIRKQVSTAKEIVGEIECDAIQSEATSARVSEPSHGHLASDRRRVKHSNSVSVVQYRKRSLGSIRRQEGRLCRIAGHLINNTGQNWT